MGPRPAIAEVRTAVRSGLADLPTGALVLVACSGGADSLALAAAVAFVAPRAGLRAGAVTVDHGLQPGSAARAQQVAAVLRDLGFDPVEVVAVDVGTAGGPEAAARTARYDALDEAAARLGAAVVLLGHTRDDQAETVLLGLARGSGARSLAGMAPVAGIYRRPLLALPRERLREACAAAGLRTWADPHNADPTYARVRVRNDVLPVLEKALGPGIDRALARTAELLRADADALDALAIAALVACTSDADTPTGPYPEGTSSFVVVSPPDMSDYRDHNGRRAQRNKALDCAALAALLPAIRTRVLRAAAIAAGAPAGALTAAHVNAVETLVTHWRGQRGIDLPGGIRAVRRCDTLTFVNAHPAGHDS
ncbi:MAG: tRNA lysidine(34) synthetase TilS [Sporichthyaceae bacterium]